MKARLIEMKTMEESIPKILSNEEQTWNFAYYCDEYQKRILDMKWHSNVPGSNADEHVILGAIQAKENMGYDVKEAESYIDSGLQAFKNKDYAKLNEITAKIFISLENAPINKDSPYWNYKIYENFEEFSKDIKFKKYPYDLKDDKYYEATHKGWIAQICGGALGTAIEGYKTSNIRKIFGEINSYVREVNTFNDDITFEIALLSAIKKKGKEVTSLDIGYEWVSLIPSAWTAEEFALRNLKIGIKPPLSGKLYNPYREWIGAQMRGAMPGMICPGDPYKAAKLAFTDGEVSHYNTGILGEVFNSIMVSLAYVKDDVRDIIDEAISYIPKDSLYYSVIKKTYEECKKGNSWEEVWGLCEKEYSIYNWIHALPNASAEVIALYFGNNDFNKTAHIVAMEGYDVDCNAAQILTILGIMNKHIDTKWTSFLNDDLETYMRNLKHISVKELASETVKASIKFNK